MPRARRRTVVIGASYVSAVEIDSSILGINGPKNRSHVGGRRHKSGRNVRLFKSIESVLFYEGKRRGKKHKNEGYIVKN
jgi:hypothetical protein